MSNLPFLNYSWHFVLHIYVLILRYWYLDWFNLLWKSPGISGINRDKSEINSRILKGPEPEYFPSGWRKGLDCYLINAHIHQMHCLNCVASCWVLWWSFGQPEIVVEFIPRLIPRLRYHPRRGWIAFFPLQSEWMTTRGILTGINFSGQISSLGFSTKYSGSF